MPFVSFVKTWKIEELRKVRVNKDDDDNICDDDATSQRKRKFLNSRANVGDAAPLYNISTPRARSVPVFSKYVRDVRCGEQPEHGFHPCRCWISGFPENLLGEAVRPKIEQMVAQFCPSSVATPNIFF